MGDRDPVAPALSPERATPDRRRGAAAPPSWLVRAVPALVVGSGLVAMALAMLVAARSGVHRRMSKELAVGPFDLLLVYTTPTLSLVLAGLLTALAFALLVVGLDVWAARRMTRSAGRPEDATSRPLRDEATSARPAGPIAVTALIPARNEARHIPATLASLRRQTRPPEAIWVIADNCTDDTADVARAHGADVYTTVENRHRKAGGLNQLLARLLPTLGPLDVVLVMDADTVMVDDFLERAIAEFDAAADLDAVGGVFTGDDAPGLLAQMQRNEYLRYGRDISRRKGRVFVLTGTASVFRADALAAVAEARGSVLPGEPGHVYDTYSLTEDNELTIALKTLGARMVSPRHCRVRTELMPSWRDLWHQRERWQRGALENIGMYGISSATARVLGPAVRPRLRRGRPHVVPHPQRALVPRVRRPRRRRVLVADRDPLRRRADGDGVARRMARPPGRCFRWSSSSGTPSSCSSST